jgi:hypothetical protein
MLSHRSSSFADAFNADRCRPRAWGIGAWRTAAEFARSAARTGAVPGQLLAIGRSIFAQEVDDCPSDNGWLLDKKGVSGACDGDHAGIVDGGLDFAPMLHSEFVGPVLLSGDDQRGAWIRPSISGQFSG